MKLLVWFIPLGLLASLLWLLIRKRAYEACPCFFSYVAFAVAADVARFVALNYPRPYYATYWITEAGYDLLGVLVMYEVLRLVLGSLARASWVRLIFPAVVVAAIGLTRSRSHAVPMQFGQGLNFYILAGRNALRFLQVFIFPWLVTLVPLLGL